MKELGIDLSGRRPQRVARELAERADVVVTMGCGDACPWIPGKRYIDWELEHPRGRPVEEVRVARNDVAARVPTLVAELDAQGPPCTDALTSAEHAASKCRLDSWVFRRSW